MTNKEIEQEREQDQNEAAAAEKEEEVTETAQADSQDPEETAEEAAEKEAAAKEEEDMKTKYLRMAADFQNFRRRTEKEKADIYAYANEKFALDLLDVIDNFERAILLQESCKDEKMKEGMELIFKQLQGVLEKNKIAEIPALGETFDPNVHNAMMTDASGEYESGKISAVLQKGYTLNGKVIRPAMVKVAE